MNKITYCGNNKREKASTFDADLWKQVKLFCEANFFFGQVSKTEVR